jgi:hypothetical protein
MLFKETFAVYCENRTGHKYQGFSSYLTEDTSHNRCKAHPVNAVHTVPRWKHITSPVQSPAG